MWRRTLACLRVRRQGGRRPTLPSRTATGSAACSRMRRGSAQKAGSTSRQRPYVAGGTERRGGREEGRQFSGAEDCCTTGGLSEGHQKAIIKGRQVHLWCLPGQAIWRPAAVIASSTYRYRPGCDMPLFVCVRKRAPMPAGCPDAQCSAAVQGARPPPLSHSARLTCSGSARRLTCASTHHTRLSAATASGHTALMAARAPFNGARRSAAFAV